MPSASSNGTGEATTGVTMGAIVNKEQDERDAQELVILAEICSAYRRYLSHHVRITVVFRSVWFRAQECEASTV